MIRKAWAGLVSSRSDARITSRFLGQARIPSECKAEDSCPMKNEDKTERKLRLSCPKSKLLLPMPSSMNHYRLFGLEETFDLDSRALSNQLKALQNVLHPDRFAGHSEEQNQLAETWSSAVNDAYQNLSKPLLRALYLLEVKGKPLLEKDIQVSNALLMDVMEINEELDEADSAEQLLRIAEDNKAKLTYYTEQVSEAFRAEDINRARELVAEMNYFSNIQDKIIQKETVFGILH